MSSLSILLVDDDPSINYLNKIIIERSEIGAEVIERTDPQEVLEQLKSGKLKPNIILLDVNMPEVNGWDFMTLLHQFPIDFQPPKVVLLTSSINPSDKKRAQSDTLVDAFHSKPLTIELVKKIAS